MKQLNWCISHLQDPLPVSGRCLWLLRASSPSLPLVPPPSLHNRLPLPPPSSLLSTPPPPTPSPTPPRFLSLHPWLECSAFKTLHSPSPQFLHWVKPVTARIKPAAHPKIWRTLQWGLRREKTLPSPTPPHPCLLLCFRLWIITRGMAAAIIQRYKFQQVQQQPQPGKRDLGVGEAGFGAAERTGYPELMDLKATTHRTGGHRAV